MRLESSARTSCGSPRRNGLASEIELDIDLFAVCQRGVIRNGLEEQRVLTSTVSSGAAALSSSLAKWSNWLTSAVARRTPRARAPVAPSCAPRVSRERFSTWICIAASGVLSS